MSMAAFRAELRQAVRDAAGAQPAPALPPARPATARRGRTVVRLWLPLTPLFVVLAPFALVASPLIALSREGRGMNPYRAAWAIGGVLLALSGTVVDVEAPDAVVRIRIY